MNRHLHDIMSAQFKTCEISGKDIISWEDGIRCIIPEITTDAADGKIVCTGRNLATPTSKIIKSSDVASAWTNGSLGKYPIPPGVYSISARYRQLGEITTVALSIRDYDSSTSEIVTKTATAESGTIFRVFTIPEGTRGCYIYLYSNCTANTLLSECEFYDIMFVRGEYKADTMPNFENFYTGGSVSLSTSGDIRLIQPSGYAQVFIGGSTVSGNQIDIKYITHS